MLACSSTFAFAQTQVQPPTRPYSVVSYDLLMDWRNVFDQQTLIFSGHNQIDVVVTGTTTAIVLDAAEMSIDSVSVNGQSITPPAIIGDTIAIPLTPAEQAIGSQLSLSIYYTHTTDTIDPQSGMFFYPKGTPSEFSSGTIPEDIAYTMSEPNGARKWMPCNDEPYSKANAAISVIVPNGYTAQSNGVLLSIDTDISDQSLTFNWVSDRPIVTYLMAAYASTWVTWHDEYHRLSNPNDSVPVNYYAWQEDYGTPDTNGGKFCAPFAFRNTPKMIAYDSKLFGEFPFSQYSQVPLDSFYFGGMEHQSITALYRGVLNGADESTIAHELFHQWFGDKTTCETWADIWLNEGFARFGEMLWAEASGGETAYENYVMSKAWEFFYFSLAAPTYNPPVDQMFNWPYAAVVYDKPSCMLHMLRRVLNNDTVFFNTLRDYSSAFAYTTANTFQFRDFLAVRDSAIAPMDLKEFINEWIFQPDWPIYNIQWTYWAQPTNVPDSTELFVAVSQSQDSTDHYTMPLRFKAVSGTDTEQLVLMNDQRSQTFDTWVNWKDGMAHSIDTLIFDQEAIPISQVTNTALTPLLGVQQSSVGSTGFLYATSIGESLNLNFSPVISNEAQIELFDILGRIIDHSSVPIGATTLSLSSQEMANGVYFVVMRDGSTSRTANVLVGN